MKTLLPAVVAFLGLGLLVAPVASQSCSDLTVTGSITGGATLTLDVTGAPAGAMTVLGISENTGTTSLNFGPIATLSLGIAMPFAVLPMGMTDASGNVSVSFSIPAGFPAGSLPFTTLYAQAVTASFGMPGPGGPPSATFCTSDVEAIAVGS